MVAANSNTVVKVRHTYSHGTGHCHLVRFCQYIPGQPGMQVKILHFCHFIQPSCLFKIRGCYPACRREIPLLQKSSFLLLRKNKGIAIVAFFQRQAGTAPIVFTRQKSGPKPAGCRKQGARQQTGGAQGQRFLVDAVAAEYFIGSFTR